MCCSRGFRLFGLIIGTGKEEQWQIVTDSTVVSVQTIVVPDTFHLELTTPVMIRLQ